MAVLFVCKKKGGVIVQFGRKEIFTDVMEITKENIISVLRQAMIDFMPNQSDCEFLLNYEAGLQSKTREKTYRKDIDCWCVDNIANEITEFKLGFNWGNPITLVQRGEKDSGTSEEATAISLLNECYEAEQIKKKTQQLARFIEICGIGYTIVDINNEYEDGDSYFTVNVLDPRYAFVVKSSRYLDHRPMLGVTFRKDNAGNSYFTCFSKNERFEIVNLTKIVNGNKEKEVDKWDHGNRSGEENPLHRIPITEWIRSHDRMGCFERQISEMDNLNLLISDFTNDVEQNTQCVWMTTDIEFPKEIITKDDGTQEERVVKPKSGDWMQTFTTQDGKTPTAKSLSVDYDYEGMLNNITTRRNTILQKCNVPIRYESSGGGSTGSATSLGSGYEAADSAANKEQLIIEDCKMEEVKTALAAINASAKVKPDNPMRLLKYKDVQPKITRQRSYELSVKTTAFAILVSHGINGMQALKAINLFEDVAQTWADSKDMVEMYQKSLFDKNNANTPEKDEKLQSNESDQITNSPIIDGMSKQKPVSE